MGGPFIFAIGEQVKAKHSTSPDRKYVVLERWYQECDGGHQIFYDCRAYARLPLSSWDVAYINIASGGFTTHQSKERFREDELAPWEGS